MAPLFEFYASTALAAAAYLLTYKPYDYLVSTGTLDSSVMHRGVFSRRWLYEGLAALLLALLHLASGVGHLANRTLLHCLVEFISAAFFVRRWHTALAPFADPPL